MAAVAAPSVAHAATLRTEITEHVRVWSDGHRGATPLPGAQPRLRPDLDPPLRVTPATSRAARCRAPAIGRAGSRSPRQRGARSGSEGGSIVGVCMRRSPDQLELGAEKTEHTLDFTFGQGRLGRQVDDLRADGLGDRCRPAAVAPPVQPSRDRVQRRNEPVTQVDPLTLGCRDERRPLDGPAAGIEGRNESRRGAPQRWSDRDRRGTRNSALRSTAAIPRHARGPRSVERRSRLARARAWRRSHPASRSRSAPRDRMRRVRRRVCSSSGRLPGQPETTDHGPRARKRRAACAAWPHGRAPDLQRPPRGGRERCGGSSGGARRRILRGPWTSACSTGSRRTTARPSTRSVARHIARRAHGCSRQPRESVAIRDGSGHRCPRTGQGVLRQDARVLGRRRSGGRRVDRVGVRVDVDVDRDRTRVDDRVRDRDAGE